MEPLTEESKGILRAWGDQVGLNVMDIVEGMRSFGNLFHDLTGAINSRGERKELSPRANHSGLRLPRYDLLHLWHDWTSKRCTRTPPSGSTKILTLVPLT